MLCIICNTTIDIDSYRNESGWGDGTFGHALANAIWCITQGNYGSTKLDRCTTDELAYTFVICDICVEKKLLDPKYHQTTSKLLNLT